MSKFYNFLVTHIKIEARHHPALSCFIGLMLFVLSGCGSSGHELKLSGDTMGTVYNLTIVTQKPVDRAALQAEVDSVLDDVNRRMSTWLPDSEVSRFNDSPPRRWFPISADIVKLIELAATWHNWSGGAYDLTVGPLIDLWGFGADDMARIPVPAEITEAMRMVGQGKLKTRLNPPALYKSVQLRINLSSVAKGYAVDLVVEALQERGIKNYLVEIGGDMRLLGHNASGQPWRVGIERPERSGSGGAMAFVALSQGAVATSGDYRNFVVEDGRYYSHVIDARTGYPVQSRLAAVTVFEEQAAQADGLVTMLQLMGEERGFKLAEAKNIAALFVLRDETGYVERATSHLKMTIER